MRALVAVFFVVATAWIALALFAFDSDGAFAVNDGIWFGILAERDPAGSIAPSHPLFHVLALAVVPALRGMGVAHPGHIAIRIVAGLGGAWLLLQILAAAGSRRVFVGGLFALVVLASRGFIVETAAGENVIPAAAAALFALTVAARSPPRVLLTGGALTLALWMRQDNVLIVPGVAIALASGLAKGRRLAGLLKVGIGAGIATLAGYVAAWRVATGGAQSFVEWIVRHRGAWSGEGVAAWDRVGVYLSSLALATTGQLWPFHEIHATLGLAVVAAILTAGLLFLGSEAGAKRIVPVMVTLVALASFHVWFEADNFEWLLLPLSLVTSLAAGLARGHPATNVVLRGAGAALLGALICWMLISHLPSTLWLRERRLMGVVEEAVSGPRRDWKMLALGGRAASGLALLGVPFQQLPERPARAAEAMARDAAPAVVLVDRIVLTGMPWVVEHHRDWRLSFDDLPDASVVRCDGLACAVFFPPGDAAGAESR